LSKIQTGIKRKDLDKRTEKEKGKGKIARTREGGCFAILIEASMVLGSAPRGPLGQGRKVIVKGKAIGPPKEKAPHRMTEVDLFLEGEEGWLENERAPKLVAPFKKANLFSEKGTEIRPNVEEGSGFKKGGDLDPEKNAPTISSKGGKVSGIRVRGRRSGRERKRGRYDSAGYDPLGSNEAKVNEKKKGPQTKTTASNDLWQKKSQGRCG